MAFKFDEYTYQFWFILMMAIACAVAIGAITYGYLDGVLSVDFIIWASIGLFFATLIPVLATLDLLGPIAEGIIKKFKRFFRK